MSNIITTLQDIENNTMNEFFYDKRYDDRYKTVGRCVFLCNISRKLLAELTIRGYKWLGGDEIETFLFVLCDAMDRGEKDLIIYPDSFKIQGPHEFVLNADQPKYTINLDICGFCHNVLNRIKALDEYIYYCPRCLK